MRTLLLRLLLLLSNGGGAMKIEKLMYRYVLKKEPELFVRCPYYSMLSTSPSQRTQSSSITDDRSHQCCLCSITNPDAFDYDACTRCIRRVRGQVRFASLLHAAIPSARGASSLRQLMRPLTVRLQLLHAAVVQYSAQDCSRWELVCDLGCGTGTLAAA